MRSRRLAGHALHGLPARNGTRRGAESAQSVDEQHSSLGPAGTAPFAHRRQRRRRIPVTMACARRSARRVHGRSGPPSRYPRCLERRCVERLDGHRLESRSALRRRSESAPGRVRDGVVRSVVRGQSGSAYRGRPEGGTCKRPADGRLRPEGRSQGRPSSWSRPPGASRSLPGFAHSDCGRRGAGGDAGTA